MPEKESKKCQRNVPVIWNVTKKLSLRVKIVETVSVKKLIILKMDIVMNAIQRRVIHSIGMIEMEILGDCYFSTPPTQPPRVKGRKRRVWKKEWNVIKK
jgi:hypothetical protein